MATVPASPMNPSVLEQAKEPSVRSVQDTPCGATKEVPITARAEEACADFVYVRKIYGGALDQNFREAERHGIRPEITPKGLEKQCRDYYSALLRYQNVLCSFEERAGKMQLELFGLKAELDAAEGIKAAEAYGTVEKINRDARLLYSSFSKIESYSYHEVNAHKDWLLKNLMTYENRFVQRAFAREMRKGLECTEDPLELKIPAIYLMGLSENTAKAAREAYSKFKPIRGEFSSHLAQGELQFADVEARAGDRKEGARSGSKNPLPGPKAPPPAAPKQNPVSETMKDAKGVATSTAKWAEKMKWIGKRHEVLVGALFVINGSRDPARVVEDLLLYGCEKLPPASIACEIGKLLDGAVKAKQERERRYKHYSVNFLGKRRSEMVSADMTAENFCRVHKETDARIKKHREEAEKKAAKELEDEGKE